MPRKPRGGRKGNARKLSANSKAGLNKVGEVVPVNTLEHCLDDFDIQGEVCVFKLVIANAESTLQWGR